MVPVDQTCSLIFVPLTGKKSTEESILGGVTLTPVTVEIKQKPRPLALRWCYFCGGWGRPWRPPLCRLSLASDAAAVNEFAL